MEDMIAHLEKLRIDAEDCALISKLATNKQKRELLERLAEHLGGLASERWRRKWLVAVHKRPVLSALAPSCPSLKLGVS
jgi:hypothetical protein